VEAVRNAEALKIEVRKMKNAILKICEKLRGYSNNEPYFEVTEVKQNENGTYTVNVQAVDPAEEQGAANESN
jgi:ribosome biogenesis protein Nip4